MDKRDILIVAIVAIVASLAVSAFAPQIGLGPPGGFGSSSVKNAHACNADEVCEINEAQVAGDVSSLTSYSHAVFADVIDTDMLFADHIETSELRTANIKGLGGNVHVENDLFMDPGRRICLGSDCIQEWKEVSQDFRVVSESLYVSGQTDTLQLSSRLCFSGGQNLIVSDVGAHRSRCSVECTESGCWLTAQSVNYGGGSPPHLTCYANCLI